MATKSKFDEDECVLGIELGSTRIKAVLIGGDREPVATGAHEWENTLCDGIWTYSLDEVWQGIEASFRNLQREVEARYGAVLTKPGAIGISGMMHGYLVFDQAGEQLTPFRTWRNNITGEAAAELTQLFQYPIPQRWSIAHLYQSILNGEPHVERIAHLTTLAGYVHWKLTGQRAMGIGEASGMFPVDIRTGKFNTNMIEQFDAQIADKGYPWKLKDLLPEVFIAGELAGELTEEGAKLLDPSGGLQAGVPLCPPEGDAGTGMVATNSIGVRTGNVSAGTSVFAMLVLEKELSRLHPELDLVTTPDGKLVAMAHSNNCTSDLNAWMDLLGESARVLGADPASGEIYERLLPLALEGDPECGGLLSYGYVSGEHVTGFDEGRPLFVRATNSRFTLANFIRMHLFSALCAMRTGLNILTEEEGVEIKEIRGHGGFFKTPGVGERIMAAATNTPVFVLETAGEGGAWGIALLAAYMSHKENCSLDDFLEPIFATGEGKACAPDPVDVAGFEAFFAQYHKSLPVEQVAVKTLGAC